MSDNVKTEVIHEEDEVTDQEEGSMEQADNSNLRGALHGGRPADEEPHIKKTLKRSGVRIDLILRVDLVRTTGKYKILFKFLQLIESIGDFRR